MAAAPAPPLPAAPLPAAVVRLDGPARSPIPVALAPDAAGRAAVAAALGLPAVRKLALRGELRPVGRAGWRLEAELGATVVQECGLTLAPVTTRIDEPVTRTYVEGLPPPPPGESEAPEDESVEALPAALDLYGVLLEALSLALPPFPRAPGAEFAGALSAEPGVEPLSDEAARPFAGLRDALRREG